MRHFSLSMPVMSWQVLAAILGISHDLGAVEVELGKDRVEALLHQRAHRRRRGVERAGHVVGLDQPLGAERLAVAHQQVHRLLPGRALAAVVHRLLGVGELHACASCMWRLCFASISVLGCASLRSRLSCSALAQRRRVDLMHAAVAGEVERVRRRRAPWRCRAHHAHARERGEIGVDAAAGGDHVVGFGRRQAAERNVMQCDPRGTSARHSPRRGRAARPARRCGRPHPGIWCRCGPHRG